MKRIFTLVCAVFAVVTMAARVVEMPRFKTSSYNQRILRSIELSDTATVVNFSFLHHPNYWCCSNSMSIKGNVTGKNYRLLRTDGYNIGEKKFMPASGRYDFKMIFEPVAETDTLINLIETKQGEICDMITDIDLTGKVPAGKILTRISGTYPKSEGFVVLVAASSNPYNDKLLWIPVDDGEFHYDFYTDGNPMAYEIQDGLSRFNGIFISGNFFTGDSAVVLNGKLDEHGEFDKFEVSAPEGSMTDCYSGVRKEMSTMWNTCPMKIKRDSLEAAKKYNVPELYALEERLQQHPEERDSIESQILKIYQSGKMRMPEGEAVDKELDEYIKNDMLRAEIDKAIAADNIAGLFMLVHKAWFTRDASPIVDAWRKVYSDKYPGHPYTEYMKSLDKTVDPVPGNRFNDFSAPDFNGVVHTLSDEIKGRIAVIDLWASWCGPCRRNSKALVPVYDEFASKGFTIVGVARESGSQAAAVHAAEQEGLKWLNLVDVDDKNGVWAIYRRQNAAGGLFLVDENGVIVAADPTPDEVREYLEKRLK